MAKFTLLDRWSPQILSLLRIVVGFLFLWHGSAKLLGYPPGMGGIQLMSLFGLAGILELVGGALVCVGLFTKPVAFILSGEMAVAYFMAHASQGFLPFVNHGEAAVFYCFVFLYLAAAGGGPISLDAMLRKRG
ncbi:MAG TPA: DoxX family protein [Gammaproteobacteria bacterium]|jgi:putative oxidoreductase|nr:DoxX family protein [Gammaproteobacteria bacterium]